MSTARGPARPHPVIASGDAGQSLDVPVLPAMAVPARQLSRTALLERCREGDQAAWRELYDAHVGRVERFARRLGVGPEEVPDVLQEVFVVVFRRLGDYDPERAAFTTWLFGITLRTVQTHRRGTRRRGRLGTWLSAMRDVVEPGPDHAYERSDEMRRLSRMLDRLPPKLRDVFVLYELEQLDGPEIARVVGCPEGTVRSRLRLARAELERIRQRRTRRGGDR